MVRAVERGKFAGIPADVARRQGWTVGTRLVGDEGYGPTTIEITAIGERQVLAKTISPRPYRETSWVFDCRDWEEVAS